MSHPVFTTKLLNLDLIVEKSQLKAGQIIADLGCGQAGNFAFLLSKIVGDKGQVYAVDIIKSNLELINRESKQHNIANITTIWSDLEILNATKIANDSVDASFLINSIHQSKKPLNILREAIRITKKGGKIILIEWSGLASPLGPETANRIDKNKLVDVSKKNGLYLESEFAAGQYHFGLVLIKV